MRTTSPDRASRRRNGAIALVAVALWLSTAGLSIAVAAAEGVDGDPFDCDAAVVDTSGRLDVELVTRRAAEVTDATVVVRGFDSTPGADLAARVDDVIARCYAGGLDDDLALFAFAVTDRQADVVLGSRLPGGSTADDLRETMTAPFGDGGFTDGVLAAIDSLEAAVESSVAAVDEAVPSADGGEPAGDTGAGATPWLVGAGVVVVGAGGGGALLVRRRRNLIEERNRFEAAATEPRLRVGSVRERGARVQAQADLWARTSSGRTLTTLQELRARARSALNGTESSAALLSEATPEGVGSATSRQLEAARIRLTALLSALDASEGALDELLAFGAHLDHLRVALPAKKNLLLAEVAEAGALAASRREEGWSVDGPAAELETVRSVLAGLDLDDVALDLLALSDRVEEAEAALFAAGHDLQSLPDRPGAIRTWRDLQVGAVEAERRRSEEAEARLRQLEPIHSPDSWRWAVDHPQRARDHLGRALARGEAAVAVAEREQRFDEAGRGLEEAGLELIAADELLDEVDDLLVDLEQARIEAPGILAEGRQVLGQFVTYVRDHARDLDDDLRAQPGELDRALDGLEAELSAARPNHLRVAEAAEHINRELDDLLAQAEEQHQRMEALRRQAGREVARAQRNLKRAQQSLGWELFQSQDSKMIARLQRALSTLPADPAARLEAARDIADDAVEIQERIIARRRRSGNWIIVGGGAGGHWGGGRTWGSGGGGGTSLGSGGGGGISLGGGGGFGRSFGGGRSTGSW